MKTYITSQAAEPLHFIGGLIEVLNETHPTSFDGGYLIEEMDHHEDDDERPRIELPDDLLEHELAMRAVATILQMTGCSRTYDGYGVQEQIIPGPFRFTYAKRAVWAGFWMWTRYLIVAIDDGFTVQEAIEQFTALAGHLADPENLVPLDAETRGLF
jgi:hypothetical protein